MDYKQKVKDKEEEQSELIERYKVDSGLLYLAKYVMMGPSGKHKVPDVINVTLNIPGRFANDVISVLGTAKEQSIVESENKNLDTTKIEAFREAGFASANARLRRQGKWELNPWFDFHSCIRGSCAARCTFQMKEGGLDPEIVLWDTRYVTYEMGVGGLKWAAYKTTKTKGNIESQEWYSDAVGLSMTDKKAEVLDVWDAEHSEVWVAGKQVFEQPHNWGFTPVVIQKVVLGSMLADEDSLAHEGESIYLLIREAVPELNRLLSIMQTLNFTTLKPPVGWASSAGETKKLENDMYDEAMSPGAITAHDIGGGITEIKFGDAQRSAQLAYSIMREAIQEATVAASDLGVIESPPASGVRAMVAGESRDQLLSPRLGVKAMMKQGLADMFTAQVIQIKGSIELGTPGHKRKFQTSELDGQYEGYYKYTIKSAAVDAGRASLAAAYGDDLSWETKATEIYQLEDVDGERRRINYEKAGRINPRVEQRRIIRDLIEMDEDEDAKLMLDDLGVSLEQLLSGSAEQLPKPQKEQEPKQVVSLFGGGGGRVTKPKAPEEAE